MKKNVYLILILLTSLSNLFAQLPSVNKAKAIKMKERILIVAFDPLPAAIY